MSTEQDSRPTGRDRWLTAPEVAQMLGVGVSTIYHWRSRGIGPQSGKSETGIVRYRKSDIEQWVRDGGYIPRGRPGPRRDASPVAGLARSPRKQEPLMYRITDAAYQLCVTATEIGRLLATGDLKGFTVGTSQMITADSLREYRQRRQSPPADNGTAPVGDAEELLAVDDLATLLGVPVSTVMTWHTEGVGPPAMRIGTVLGFRWADVDTWMKAKVDQTQGGQS